MAKKELNDGDYIARGILIGGAVGVFAALFKILPSIFWGCGLGMFAGFMAGVTMASRRKK